jgi:TRAP-type C4-dicarboxylate transport system permease small subunit
MNRISTIVTYIGAAAVVVLALTTCIDVLGRYLFNAPLQGTYELTENFLCIIAACGIAAATATGEHISVDSFFERLSPVGQRILALFGAFLELVVFSVLCWQGIVAVRESIIPYCEVVGSVVPIVTYPFRIVLVLGFFLSVIALVYTIVRLCRSRASDRLPS